MTMEWFVPGWQSIVGVILSTLGMYLTIIVFARWSGVRSFAEMSPFDIAVTVALGSLMATVAASKNPPLLQGLAALITLYAVQWLVSQMRERSDRFEVVTDCSPILLMGPGGEMKHRNMQVARVTENDLRTYLRAANVADLATVRAVIMEGTGEINVLHGADGKLDSDAWILNSVRDYTNGDRG